MSDGYTLSDLQRIREEMRPYPLLREGDPVGWVDRDGTVHVETYHREPQGNPLERLQTALSAVDGVVRDITDETGESRVLAAIAELEAQESRDEIDSTVLWQLKEGCCGGRPNDDADLMPPEESAAHQDQMQALRDEGGT